MYKFKQPQYQSGSQIQQTNTLQYINTLDKCTQILREDRIWLRGQLKSNDEDVIKIFKEFLHNQNKKQPLNMQHLQIRLRKYVTNVKSRAKMEQLNRFKENLQIQSGKGNSVASNKKNEQRTSVDDYFRSQPKTVTHSHSLNKYSKKHPTIQKKNPEPSLFSTLRSPTSYFEYKANSMFSSSQSNRQNPKTYFNNNFVQASKEKNKDRKQFEKKSWETKNITNNPTISSKNFGYPQPIQQKTQRDSEHFNSNRDGTKWTNHSNFGNSYAQNNTSNHEHAELSYGRQQKFGITQTFHNLKAINHLEPQQDLNQNSILTDQEQQDESNHAIYQQNFYDQQQNSAQSKPFNKSFSEYSQQTHQKIFNASHTNQNFQRNEYRYQHQQAEEPRYRQGSANKRQNEDTNEVPFTFDEKPLKFDKLVSNQTLQISKQVVKTAPISSQYEGLFTSPELLNQCRKFLKKPIDNDQEQTQSKLKVEQHSYSIACNGKFQMPQITSYNPDNITNLLNSINKMTASINQTYQQTFSQRKNSSHIVLTQSFNSIEKYKNIQPDQLAPPQYQQKEDSTLQLNLQGASSILQHDTYSRNYSYDSSVADYKFKSQSNLLKPEQDSYNFFKKYSEQKHNENQYNNQTASYQHQNKYLQQIYNSKVYQKSNLLNVPITFSTQKQTQQSLQKSKMTGLSKIIPTNLSYEQQINKQQHRGRQQEQEIQFDSPQQMMDFVMTYCTQDGISQQKLYSVFPKYYSTKLAQIIQYNLGKHHKQKKFNISELGQLFRSLMENQGYSQSHRNTVRDVYTLLDIDQKGFITDGDFENFLNQLQNAQIDCLQEIQRKLWNIYELANEYKGSNPGIDYWCLYAVKQRPEFGQVCEILEQFEFEIEN